MEILGIGPSELIFIVVIALIVLGPKDMQKAGKTIGQYLNKIVRSDGWKVFQKTSQELRNLPNNLMREANLDLTETEREIGKSMGMRSIPSASTLTGGLVQPQEAENSILPPSATNTDEPAIIIETPDEEIMPPNQNA